MGISSDHAKLLAVSSRREMTADVASFRPHLVVSLIDPGARLLYRHEHHLVLRFHDDYLPRRHRRPASRKDIALLLEVVADLSLGRRVLIHCHAGVSRSPAAAYCLLCAARRRGDEPACWQYALSLRARAEPSMRVVELADDLLERNGEMIRVARAWFRNRYR